MNLMMFVSPQQTRGLWVHVLAGLLLVAGCQSSDSPTSESVDSVETVQEVAPRPLPLASPLDRPEIEISGLTWYGDTLVVLPQYPSRPAGPETRQIYGLSRSALRRAVRDSTAPPLDPIHIPLATEKIDQHAADYEGCEAIAFDENRVFVLIEGTAEGEGMRGHLLRGQVAPGLTRIRLQGSSERELPQQAALNNMSYEALVMRDDTVLTLFEANGARVNASPQAYRYTDLLEPLGSLPFPALEYRLTDETALDARQQFWVTNYFYPGERDVLRPASDSLVHRFGEGATHQESEVVERLVEYRYTPEGIRRTDRAPIWLKLSGGAGRNWEGIARFRDGFLVATDRFPRTILAYVPRSDH